MILDKYLVSYYYICKLEKIGRIKHLIEKIGAAGQNQKNQIKQNQNHLKNQKKGEYRCWI